MKNKTIFFISFFLILLNACSPVADTQENLDQAIDLPTETLVPSATPKPTETFVPPVPTRELISRVCSPLEGELLSELGEIITQPFKTPRPANDDGHQGVDFAYYQRKNRDGIEGLPVLAALPGTVATVLGDRYPYGYTVIIETSLDLISPELIETFSMPQSAPTVVPDPRVNCPPGELDFKLDYSKKSLYILYAHLQKPVLLQVGDTVACGQTIGQVGNTGWSSNPHLHFETRIGPAGARFESMAY